MAMLSAHDDSRGAFDGTFDTNVDAQARSGPSARRSPFLIALFSIGLVAAHAPTPLRAATAPSVSCETVYSPELRVQVINEAGAPPKALDAAAEEVSAIWARVGVRITWALSPKSVSAPDGRTVLVIIRRELSKPSSVTAGSKGRVGLPLGWLTFGQDGQPGNLIEVSYGRLVALVRQGSQLNKRIATLPDLAQDPILGRGLGRVVAHEIGHWFMGRGHMQAGVMKASFGPGDLIELGVPRLPREFSLADAEERMARSARCAPLASHPLMPGAQQPTALAALPAVTPST